MILNSITGPEVLKDLSLDELQQLAAEIRTALIERISHHGGHFGPNLGLVEATIALHYVFNSPVDKLVFDVSHQIYTHKMLTGRVDSFLDPSKYDDVTGFSNFRESEHDCFVIGHTSTSISLALGLAKARDLKSTNENIVAIIGDGSLSGGEALEGLNVAGELNSNLIIVVNDNDMSIAENHGGLYKNLKELRESNGTSQNNLFKAMGLDYVFVPDGNDVESLISAFALVKDTSKPIVVHICTIKGKGYSHAENNKEQWHYAQPFTIETGEPLFSFSKESYGSITLDYLLTKMSEDNTVINITSGTPTIVGFTKDIREKHENQFIDVGIAEGTAIALSSGIARNGGKPVYSVFSSFIQRAFDQLSQDVCLNETPVTILVHGASVYGMSDATHIGIFDIPLMSNIPNLVYLAPTCKEEYLAMLDWSIDQNSYPVAIRVPGNGVVSSPSTFDSDYSKINKYILSRKGTKVAILALGSMFQLGEEIANRLNATLVNPRYITGLDIDILASLVDSHDLVVTIEDGILDGGFGQKIASFYGSTSVKVLNYGLNKEFYDRRNSDEVLKECRMTANQIIDDINKLQNKQ